MKDSTKIVNIEKKNGIKKVHFLNKNGIKKCIFYFKTTIKAFSKKSEQKMQAMFLTDIFM